MDHFRVSWGTWLRNAFCLLLGGCTGVPKGIKPVENFDLARYGGRWYEIARLDHSFERNLEDVTATYTARKDGGVDVLNQGYNTKKEKWVTAKALAYPVGSQDVGHLKVSFWGPFYSSYIVFELDHKDYSYAFVVGNSRKYLWLLARTPEVPPKLKADFLTKVKGLGFDTSKLIFPSQKRVESR